MSECAEIRLGPFALQAPMGRGAMAEVWRGRHVGLDVPIALKIVTGDRARSPRHRELFRQEVRAVAGLDHPGIVRVFCEIHSHMSAFILVFGHQYFAATSPDGRYQIARVPPGRYTLVAWNDGAVRESRQIVMGEDGGVEADFSLR